jgi:Zn finger protein HypA/HybF involved in hydrogenase expression
MKQCVSCSKTLGRKNVSGRCVDCYRVFEKEQIAKGIDLSIPKKVKTKCRQCNGMLSRRNESGICGTCSDIKYQRTLRKRLTLCDRCSEPTRPGTTLCTECEVYLLERA